MLIEQDRDIETHERNHLLERLRFGLISEERVRSAAVLGNELCASLFPPTKKDIDPYCFNDGNHGFKQTLCVVWTNQLKIAKAVSLLTHEEADLWAEIVLKRVLERIKDEELSSSIKDIHKSIRACAPGEKMPSLRTKLFELTGGDEAHARRSNLRRSALILLTILGNELTVFKTDISWTFIHPSAQGFFDEYDTRVLLLDAALNYASEYSVKEMAYQKADAIRFLLS